MNAVAVFLAGVLTGYVLARLRHRWTEWVRWFEREML